MPFAVTWRTRRQRRWPSVDARSTSSPMQPCRVLRERRVPVARRFARVSPVRGRHGIESWSAGEGLAWQRRPEGHPPGWRSSSRPKGRHRGPPMLASSRRRVCRRRARHCRSSTRSSGPSGGTTFRTCAYRSVAPRFLRPGRWAPARMHLSRGSRFALPLTCTRQRTKRRTSSSSAPACSSTITSAAPTIATNVWLTRLPTPL